MAQGTKYHAKTKNKENFRKKINQTSLLTGAVARHNKK